MNANGVDPLPAPKPAPAPQGGKNGEIAHPAGALNRAMFADIVAQREHEPSPDRGKPPRADSSPKAEAAEAPEELEQPLTQDEPGKDNLPTEEKPEGEGDEPQPEEADETVLSQDEDKAFTEKLSGLNADAKQHLLEIAEAIAKGETTIGQVKRQFKLGRQENEELTQLREKVKALESAPPTATAAVPNIPPSVQKLKTAEEVEARSEHVETSIRAIEDFLEENPQGGQIGDKEFTRPELIAKKRAYQDELKVLPKWGRQLQQQAQFNQVKAQNRAQIVKDFPVLADPENPDTKAAQALMKNDPIINQYPNADYLALALARGHRELQKELLQRKAAGSAARTGQAGGTRPAVQTGTVPARKPHTGSTAPARPAAATAPPVGDLLKAVKDRNSFAELIDQTGR